MPNITMTSAPLEELQALSTRCLNLPKQLYTLISQLGLSTGELTGLASNINDLGKSCKSLSPWLQGSEIPSIDSFADINDIVHQCDAVFKEVEAIAPVLDLGDNASAQSLAVGEGWSWNSLPRDKLAMLATYTRALEKTLGLIGQTFRAAECIAQSRWSPSDDTANTERLQVENLVVEQQLALLTALRLNQEYLQNRSSSGMDELPAKGLSVSPRSMALAPYSPGMDCKSPAPYRNSALNPESLGRFLEKSLRFADKNTRETEDLARIHVECPRFVDSLLHKWTRTSTIPRMIDLSPRSCEFDEGMWERKKSQQPTCETDEETDADLRTNEKRHRKGGPVLKIPSAVSRTHTAPIPVPGGGRSQGSVASRTPNDGNSSVSNSAISPTPPMSTPTFNQNPSPRLGVSWSTPLSAPTPTRPEASSAVSTHSSQSSEAHDDGLRVPYRIRLHNATWYFEDDTLVKQRNASIPLEQAFVDRMTKTLIPFAWVCDKSLDQMGLSYRIINHEVETSRRSKFEKYFEIDGPLRFPTIQQLVDRSAQIVAEQRNRERRHSSIQSSRPQSFSHAHATETATLGSGMPRRVRSEWAAPKEREWERMVQDTREAYSRRNLGAVGRRPSQRERERERDQDRSPWRDMERERERGRERDRGRDYDRRRSRESQGAGTPPSDREARRHSEKKRISESARRRGTGSSSTMATLATVASLGTLLSDIL